MRAPAVESLLYQFVLLLPNLTKPGVHLAPEIAIVFVVTLHEPLINRPASNVDKYLYMTQNLAGPQG
jgi:hypothetical protein